jgi:hypothetical protein
MAMHDSQEQDDSRRMFIDNDSLETCKIMMVGIALCQRE